MIGINLKGEYVNIYVPNGNIDIKQVILNNNLKELQISSFSIDHNSPDNLCCTTHIFKPEDYDNLFITKNNTRVTELMIPNYKDEDDSFPYLTVSTHNKWYEVYLIHEDNTAEAVHLPFRETDYPMNYPVAWNDHNINPEYFYLIAKYFNATIVHDAWIAVLDQWLDEQLDGDILKLHYFLPR